MWRVISKKPLYTGALLLFVLCAAVALSGVTAALAQKDTLNAKEKEAQEKAEKMLKEQEAELKKAAEEAEKKAKEQEAEFKKAAEEMEEKAREMEERIRIMIDEHGISVESDEEGGKAPRARVSIGVDGDTIFEVRPGRYPRRLKETATDIVRFGEDVYVEADELVSGDLVVFGGDVTIEGKVMGDAVVFGGDLEVVNGAEINGNAIAIGGEIIEGEDVRIQGERVTVKSVLPFIQNINFIWGPRARIIKFTTVPLKFIFMLILSFIVLALMKNRLLKSRSYLEAEYAKSFGWGLLISIIAVFAVPVASIILAITIIGIPLAMLLGLACFIVIIVAWTIFAYDLGLRTKAKIGLGATSPYAILTVGTIVLFLPLFIGYGVSIFPLMGVFGFLIKLFANLFILFAITCGIGALFSSRFGGTEITAASAPASPVPPSSPPPAAEGPA